MVLGEERTGTTEATATAKANATAKADAKANTGILHCVQDDDFVGASDFVQDDDFVGDDTALGSLLGLHLFCDALDGVVGGEDCALLPADEMGEIVACEVGLALWFF
jgi:hypothetical protein